jgi:ferric-dicitrate binding protein FerR (iron transport regulator)
LRVAAIIILIFISGGALSYFIFKPQEEAAVIAFNEIRAPLGARSEIILPDGSQVWLNAGSKLKYLNVFNKTNRMVSLEGEGYFKVAKNSKLPFNVKAGDLYIVALGTEFNVKSYNDEGIIETTLVEGKVSIRQNQQSKQKSQTVYLGPHQKAVYVKDEQQLTVEDLKAARQVKPEILKMKKGIMYVADRIDPEPIISWKDNRLILKGEELSSLLIKLERKYDVTFLYESDNIKQFRFTGTLENETLTQVLDVIKLSAPIDYMLEGKIVRITENKLMTKKFSGHLKKKDENH